jgi:D-tyrosyl-tRNA(Tyr) deacylase
VARQNSVGVRAVLQRVSEASVTVGSERIAAIGRGLLVLVAAGVGDDDGDAERLAGKIARLRIFADDEGRMNRSVADVGGQVLCVSQFTLYADTNRGNRPGFTGAAAPDEGARLVALVAERLADEGLAVQTGRFGSHMEVALVNDGPVTIWLDTR